MSAEIRRLLRFGHGQTPTGNPLRRSRKSRVVLQSPLVVDDGDLPWVRCPACGAEQADADGFGVLHCPTCGYCTHPSITGDRCGLCGRHVPDGGEA